MENKKDVPDSDWYFCTKCSHVWYLLNQRSPFDRSSIPDREEQTRRCPVCNDPDIKKIDIQQACCSWVTSEIHCRAIFGREGYYKRTQTKCTPINWRIHFEKELINFDGNFKTIISSLANQSRDPNFVIVPELYRSDEEQFKTYYPMFEEIVEKQVPIGNSLEIMSFLESEGAVETDRVIFSFCPGCGAKNRLEFRMKEKECSACGAKGVIPCDHSCPEYDTEYEECRIASYPKPCCFILPNGGCLGPKWLEFVCQNCEEYDVDSIVDFDPPDIQEIDTIIDPEGCSCLAISYKPLSNVLAKLNEGFTFQEMIADKIGNQGWNVTVGREIGESGVYQDVDALCEKGSKRVLVESKRLMTTKYLALDIILNLFARMQDLHITNGLVITTTSHVSPEAKRFADHYRIRILPVGEFLKKDIDAILQE